MIGILISDDIRSEIAREQLLLAKVKGLMRRCRNYAGLGLCVNARGNEKLYYTVSRSEGRKIRKYINRKNRSKVAGIVNARHCKKAARILENNISCLETVLAKYRDADLYSIMDALPPVYRMITPEIRSLYWGQDARDWVDEKIALRDSQPRPFPDDLQVVTNSGEKVRSKSEALVYNLLLGLGLPFVYELPFQISPLRTKYPDFTIYIGDGLFIILEHDGAFSEGKRASTYEKMEDYFKLGLMMNMDVLFTFDDYDGHINTAHIKKQIQDCIESKRLFCSDAVG